MTRLLSSVHFAFLLVLTLAHGVSASINQNCWSFVDADLWPRVIRFDDKASSIYILVNQTGPRAETCLRGSLLDLKALFR